VKTFIRGSETELSPHFIHELNRAISDLSSAYSSLIVDVGEGLQLTNAAESMRVSALVAQVALSGSRLTKLLVCHTRNSLDAQASGSLHSEPNALITNAIHYISNGELFSQRAATVIDAAQQAAERYYQLMAGGTVQNVDPRADDNAQDYEPDLSPYWSDGE
jgi:hypothetical protein